MTISDAVKLDMYNGALLRLGSRRIASLTENREPRRVLDDAWGSTDSVINRALEKGEWNFAIRAVEATYSPSVTPDFGHHRAFEKPDDFRRLAALSSDQMFRNPLTDDQYTDEANYWLCGIDVLYIRYVSSGTSFGFNSSRWTQAFKDYIECDLAWEICERITNSTSKRDRLERDRMNALKGAKSGDAMQDGVKFLRGGSWSQSRRGARAR